MDYGLSVNHDHKAYYWVAIISFICGLASFIYVLLFISSVLYTWVPEFLSIWIRNGGGNGLFFTLIISAVVFSLFSLIKHGSGKRFAVIGLVSGILAGIIGPLFLMMLVATARAIGALWN